MLKQSLALSTRVGLVPFRCNHEIFSLGAPCYLLFSIQSGLIRRFALRNFVLSLVFLTHAKRPANLHKRGTADTS